MHIITQSSVITIVCKSQRFCVTIKLGKWILALATAGFYMHLVYNYVEMLKKIRSIVHLSKGLLIIFEDTNDS